MTVGVFCEEKRERVSFEQCIDCAKCLPAPIIKNLRIFDNKPLRNMYYLREVIGCVRRSYYERKIPADNFPTLRSLYSRKRGELFGGITGSKGWQELDCVVDLNVDNEPVKFTARLDCYDPKQHGITELKSLEGVFDRELPREKDVLQVQCYGTLFKNAIGGLVSWLRLLYLDMNEFLQIHVEQRDMSQWLKERVNTLHRAVRDSKPPAEEVSQDCKYCAYKTKCIVLKPMIPNSRLFWNREETRGRYYGAK
jgi:hypothetical protein